MRTIVLDSGAFIAVERKSRALTALMAEAGDRVITSANVIAETWRPPPSYGVSVLMRSVNEIVPVSAESAQRIGALLAISGTLQITDAHVVTIAVAHTPALILTSDPDDIERLLAHTEATWKRGGTAAVSVDVIVAPI